MDSSTTSAIMHFKVEQAMGSLQAWEEVRLGETRAGILPGEYNRAGGGRQGVGGVEKRQERSKKIRIVAIPGSLEKGSHNLIWPIGTRVRDCVKVLNSMWQL